MNIPSHSKALSILLFSAVSILCLSTAILYIFPTYHSNNTSALTYQTESNISFTFSPMISISVSSNTIDIPTLAPGTTAESNPIAVTVGTNTAYGYSLYADVGNSTDYNTTSLVQEDNSNSNSSSNNSNEESDALPSIFASIPTNASLPSLTTDNTWGYSYKPSNESTWSTYNGLPLYSTTDSHTSTSNPALLIDTKDPGDNTGSIDFKIAARSSSTQPSGTYNNVINFYAVGKPKPIYMQETDIIKSQLKNTGDEMQVIDNRDGKTYWIAKLADGNIWMTQNLDLDIDPAKTYTTSDTDISANWTPIRATTVDMVWDDTAAGNVSPYSYDPGDRYWKGAPDNIGGNINTETTATGDAHYHIGNYYNWTAAVAMNNSSSYVTNKYNVNQSICPAGWRLPTYDGDQSYGNLITKQDLTSGTGGNIQKTPTYFVYGGSWEGKSNAVSFFGGYWYGVVSNSYNAFFLSFNTYMSPFATNFTTRYAGYSVRCLVRQ